MRMAWRAPISDESSAPPNAAQRHAWHVSEHLAATLRFVHLPFARFRKHFLSLARSWQFSVGCMGGGEGAIGEGATGESVWPGGTNGRGGGGDGEGDGGGRSGEGGEGGGGDCKLDQKWWFT